MSGALFDLRVRVEFEPDQFGPLRDATEPFEDMGAAEKFIATMERLYPGTVGLAEVVTPCDCPAAWHNVNELDEAARCAHCGDWTCVAENLARHASWHGRRTRLNEYDILCDDCWAGGYR
jgi:hypothetical protein